MSLYETRTNAIDTDGYTSSDLRAEYDDDLLEMERREKYGERVWPALHQTPLTFANDFKPTVTDALAAAGVIVGIITIVGLAALFGG